MSKRIFDKKALKAELDEAEIMQDFEGNKVQTVFLGTVFQLMPSGKYYMPWACSNLDVCKSCKGTLKSKKTETCPYCMGEGKRICEEHFNYEGISKAVGQVIRPGDSFTCLYCDGVGTVHKTCGWCGGVGSREAYLDECWRERAEKELDALGAYLESGEGDPCDLFATRPVAE